MAKIETNHPIVGKALAEIRDLDIGTLYPVIDDSQRVIGVYSAEFGTPDGYYLNRELQAFCDSTDLDNQVWELQHGKS